MNLVLQTFNETIEFLPGYEVKDHDNLTQFSDKAAALAFLHHVAVYLRDVSALRTLLVKEGNGINVSQLNDSQMLEVLADRLRYGRIKVRRIPKLRPPAATGIGSEQQYMTPREVEQLEKKRRGERMSIPPLAVSPIIEKPALDTVQYNTGPHTIILINAVQLDEFKRLNQIDIHVSKEKPGEASAAVEIQNALKSRLRRAVASDGEVDFVFTDEPLKGKIVDFMFTPNDLREQEYTNKFFDKNFSKIEDKLKSHIEKADIVPLDFRSLNTSNQNKIRELIDTFSDQQKSKIWIIQ